MLSKTEKILSLPAALGSTAFLVCAFFSGCKVILLRLTEHLSLKTS